ncbi:pseudouridylate synthase TRUB1 isoform X2 [Zonotrichia albicollis]|uniref:pseudouridylate synthase TRUB1 isoform X2 n=1 Tax=Zonotrichia albicollis TaxID=44394 RepID=UPI003D80E270
MAGEAGGTALGRAADKLFSLSGLFAVRKPKGPTSAAVLNLLKERLLAEAGVQTNGNKRNQVLKIGHGGTLDSAATGVLVVGIGKGTKMLGTMLAGSKKYTAIGMLGKATDTLDATGKVTEEKPYDQVTKGDLENVLQKFTGDIMQVPPLYSALKKDGERLSTLMKRGEAVEAKPARPVRVYSLSLQQFQPPLFTLDVECGGGFYVRSLVNDIGKGFPRTAERSARSPPCPSHGLLCDVFMVQINQNGGRRACASFCCPDNLQQKIKRATGDNNFPVILPPSKNQWETAARSVGTELT